MKVYSQMEFTTSGGIGRPTDTRIGAVRPGAVRPGTVRRCASAPRLRTASAWRAAAVGRRRIR